MNPGSQWKLSEVSDTVADTALPRNLKKKKMSNSEKILPGKTVFQVSRLLSLQRILK